MRSILGLSSAAIVTVLLATAGAAHFAAASPDDCSIPIRPPRRLLRLPHNCRPLQLSRSNRPLRLPRSGPSPPEHARRDTSSIRRM